MKNESLVSIIVPVYNVEKYLKECVESLLRQTYENVEIILVDDGSTDTSAKLCESYASMNKNVFVHHQKNAGLSAARNTGLRYAHGDYILFVDSDDYIDIETVKKFVVAAQDGDYEIVCGDEKKLLDGVVKSGLNRNVDENKVYTGEEILAEMIKKGEISMCAPFALYSAKLIKNNMLFFKEGIFHEDEEWTPRVYLCAKRVKYLKYEFYYHRFRVGSITQKKNKIKNSMDLIATCFELYDIYNKIQNSENRDYLMNNLCTLYLSAVYIGKNVYADRNFAIKTARLRKNKIKAWLYKISPKIYIAINNIVKKF